MDRHRSESMTKRPRCNQERISDRSPRSVPRTLRRTGRSSRDDRPRSLPKLEADAIFLWDRIHYPPRNRPVADVWVVLSAIAAATQSIRLGPMITPLPRRRVQKVARETVTLDHLSRGRLTMGVGLGNVDDFEPFGEEVDPRYRACLWIVASRPRQTLGKRDSSQASSPTAANSDLGGRQLAPSAADTPSSPMGRIVSNRPSGAWRSFPHLAEETRQKRWERPPIRLDRGDPAEC